MEGGKIFCVNPAGIPDNLYAPIEARNSKDFVINSDYGKFDKFFEALHEDLKALSEPSVPREKPKFNPFKFLENYGPNDRDMLYEREAEENEVMECLFGKTRQMVIHVVGPAKAGKTSFVRARLLPGFDKKPALSVYLRCPAVPVGKLKEWLPQALAGPKRRPTDKEPTARFTGSLEDTIKKLAEDANKESKQAVVVLDDFDRLLAKDAETDRATLVLLADLAEACKDKNLSFLCVGTLDRPYTRATDQARQQRCWVDALEKDQVATIIRKLAARADIQFDEEVIEEIISQYAPSKDDEQHPFTMAHVQALCHLLADRKKVDIRYYREIMDKQGRGLNAALNVKEFFSSLEDLPDESRNLLRKVVKFIEGDSKQHIARCVQEHRMDLLAA
jgi:type II secretory pathway predicted ATPase ExeA